jgi:hypothetical protein
MEVIAGFFSFMMKRTEGYTGCGFFMVVDRLSGRKQYGCKRREMHLAYCYSKGHTFFARDSLLQAVVDDNG